MRPFTPACLAVASALACALAAESPRPRYGGTLRMETVAGLGTFTLDSSQRGLDTVDAASRDRIRALVFETLVTPAADGGVYPVLATAWESDARATRWRFTIRRGVTVHDGSTLTVQDVATALGSPGHPWQVTAESDAITIATDRPMPDLLWEVADVGRCAIGVARAGQVVGTGPFAVARTESDRTLTLRAHDEHWAGRPFLDAIQITRSRPLIDQLHDLEGGRADLVTVGARDTLRLVQRGLRVAASRPVELVALALQPNPAGLADPQARRALSLAIDRVAIADVLLQRIGVPAATLLPQWLTGYAAMFEPAQDRALARSIVKALPPAHRNLTLRFEPSDPLARVLAERIVADAREVGLAVTLDPVQPPSFRPIDFRFVRIKLDTMRPGEAALRLMPHVHPQVRSTLPPSPDPGAPLDDVYRVERGFMDQYVLIPLVHVPEVYGVSPHVESFSGELVLPSFTPDLANVWLRSSQP